MSENTKRLRELEMAATPSPWTSDPFGQCIRQEDIQMMVAEMRGWGYLTGKIGLDDDVAMAKQRVNADLICTMRNAMPVLLDERDADKAEIERLKEDVTIWRAIATRGEGGHRQCFSCVRFQSNAPVCKGCWPLNNEGRGIGWVLDRERFLRGDRNDEET